MTQTSKFLWDDYSSLSIDVFFALLIAGLVACTSPELRFSQQAESYGFEKKIMQGLSFQHVVYSKPSISNNTTLHIYLDGDGTTWINHRWVASNPTPRNAMLLDLMRQDNNTAIYIGRPCYHGLSQSAACTAELWTSHRYSHTVINTMVAVIQTMVNHYDPDRIILIGYSGGGTLAMLVAEQLPYIVGIVTIAANLDIDAWTSYHSYLPLAGSLNPAQRAPLAKGIFQLHLAGARDNNIPLKQIKAFVKRQPFAQLRVFDDYDHHCCWKEIWPSILSSIDTDD